MPRALDPGPFTFRKKWSGVLRLKLARALHALMPADGSQICPVLTREQLETRAGWSLGSGTINDVFNGIRTGSGRASPHRGLLDLGLVNDVEHEGKKAYQITPAGLKAILHAIEENGELPPVKDKASCTNYRYLGANLTHEEIIEGRRLLKLHKFRERKLRIVIRKKKSVLKATGLLLCEACSFDFAAVYGKLGDGFAECHHRLPLAEYDAEAPTRLEDLAIVCANCHRMLHRSRPMMKVEELRSLILQRRAGR
jgi:hypothetical protein